MTLQTDSNYTGTARYDVDFFPALPTSVNFGVNQTTQIINFTAVNDVISDNGEVLIINGAQTPSCNPIASSITIWDNPSLSATATPVTCGSPLSGSILANAANGSGSYLFSKDNVTWQASTLFTGLASGPYTIYAKNVGSCVAPVSTNLSVGTAGTITASAGGPYTICNGQSVQLQGSGGATYSWTSVPAGFTSSQQNPTVSPTVYTTYNLTVTSGGSCSGTASTTVTVNPVPVAAITPVNPNICVGSNTTLTASGGGSYLWYSTGATTPSISVNPVVSTSYTVEVTANGCKATAIANVDVHPLPTAVLSGGSTICSGGDPANLNVRLTGTGPWTIIYTDGTTQRSVTTPNNNPDFNFPALPLPTVNSTYTLVSVTDNWGCVNTGVSGSASIIVNPAPSSLLATASVTPNDFCPGTESHITLTSSGGTGTSVRWHLNTWNGPLLGEELVGVPVIIPPPTTTTTYYARYVNSCGESLDFATVTVNILAAPTQPTNISTGNPTKPNAFCVTYPPSGIYRLTAEGSLNATGYEWFKDGCAFGAPLPGVGAGGITYEPNISIAGITNYYVRAINTTCAPSQCTSITLTIFPPSVAGTISGAATVCAGTNGGTLTLNGKVGEVTKWQYKDVGGWIDIANTSTSLTYFNLFLTTQYQAVVQSGIPPNACPSVTSASATITVNALPVVAQIAGGAPSVCVNTSTPAFTDATSGGTWSITPVTGTASITTGGVVTGLTAGSVTIVYTYSNGTCSNTATTSLTVNPLPVVAQIVGGAPTVCVSTTTPAFTDATAGGTWSITPGTGTASITGGGVVTGLTAGTVTVVYTYSNGTCSNTATTSLTVNSLPAPTITGPANVCINSEYVYTTEAGMSNYQWSYGPVGDAGRVIISGGGPSDNSVTIKWSTNGPKTVRVNVTNANGCTKLSSITNVFVNLLPATPTITAGGPLTFCSGGSVTLTSSAGTSYLWSTGATTSSINVNSSGSYTVRVTNAAGCQSAASTATAVTVNALPTLSGSSNVCPGLTTQWNGSGTPAVSNPWTSSNTLVATVSPSGLVTGVAAGTSNITYTDINGCSKTNMIGVGALPAITVHPANKTGCYGNQVVFSASFSPAAIHYQWQRKAPGGSFADIDITEIPGANGNTSTSPITLTVSNIGASGINIDQSEYRVIISMQALGCSVTSGSAILTVNPLPTTSLIYHR